MEVYLCCVGGVRRGRVFSLEGGLLKRNKVEIISPNTIITIKRVTEFLASFKTPRNNLQHKVKIKAI